MGLVIPESFHFGAQQFPWDGRIEPYIYRRRKWILATPVTYGPVPVLDVSSGGVNVVTSTQGPSVEVGVSSSAVQVYASGITVFRDLCTFGGIPVSVLQQSIGVSGSASSITALASQESIGVVYEEPCASTQLTLSQPSVGVTSTSTRRFSVTVR